MGIDANKARAEFTAAVLNRDAKALSEFIEGLYSNIPARLHERGRPGDGCDSVERSKESFYHSILHAILKSIGFRPRSEAPGSTGNADLVVFLENGACAAVMELKYAQDINIKDVESVLENLAKKALKAIRDNEYRMPHRVTGVELLTIGVGVSGRGRVSVLFGDSQGFELPLPA
jgi:hypothetical protein